MKLDGGPLLKSPTLTACEIYPAQRDLDWPNSPTAPLNVQVLGSETKIIAITSDPALLARLKL